jgi:FkbM family methyltransferase
VKLDYPSVADSLVPYAVREEDRWILSQFPEDYVGTAFEAGALDGRFLSNTLMLEEKGWRCICVEPNPRFRDILSKNRKFALHAALGPSFRDSALVVEDSLVYANTRSRVTFNAPGESLVLTIDQCIRLAGFDRLDVLSLDTDGEEEWILSGFDPKRWQTKVLVIEVDGGPDDPAHLWALENGFRLERTIVENNCYVRAE